MSAFDVEVRVRIPADQFKHIYQVAVTNNTTAESLVAELVRRGLTVPPEKVRPPAPPKPAYRRPAPVRSRPHKAAAEKLEGLVRLHAQGLSDNEVARELGMSPSWVGVHRNRLNLPRNAQPGPQPRITKIEGVNA